MNLRALQLPFRLGTTSYIIADDLLANARFLTPLVQDMQLVLFDIENGPSNLPAPQTIEALAALGTAADLTYTVHLLDDLQNDGQAAPRSSLRRAKQVIDLTRPLRPWAWVGHLEGRAVRPAGTPAPDLAAWQNQTAHAVAEVTTWLDDPLQLAIENLEGYPPAFVDPVVQRVGAGRCVDAGHLLLDGHDPVPHLRAALPRLRVVHLHGVAERDHASLAHIPAPKLDAILRTLLDAQFTGVVTMEIFGEEDFWSSLDVITAAIARIR
jgi:sugar phosphate isomerase/epimerase